MKTYHKHTGMPWILWREGKGLGELLSINPDCYYGAEQEDSVLGLVGVVISGGRIISIDDWKLYDADFDAPDALLEQLEAWEDYTPTEEDAQVEDPREALEKALGDAFGEMFAPKKKTWKDYAKTYALDVLWTLAIALASVLVYSVGLLYLIPIVENTLTFGVIGLYDVMCIASGLFMATLIQSAVNKMVKWIWEG